MWKGIVLLLLLAGCASMSEAEKEVWEDQRRIAEANWYNCEAVYEQAGKITYHEGHTHQWWDKRSPRAVVKSDLLTNDCERILGEEWLEAE